jgi:hypothetical protein
MGKGRVVQLDRRQHPARHALLSRDAPALEREPLAPRPTRPARATWQARPVSRSTVEALADPGTRARAVLRLQRHAGNRAVAAVIQRRITPEDLTAEMAGLPFTVSQQLTIGAVTLAPDDRLTVVTWDNASTTVRMRVLGPHGGAGTEVDVPKKLLRSAPSATPGIAPYGVGIEKVVRDFERGEQKIAAEQARKGGARAKVIAELEGLQRNRERLLNRRLIQAAMLNRFDASIRTWVDYYNQIHGFTTVLGQAKAGSLDPNLVKSMLFQETKMGTAGEHLEDLLEPDPKVKTRQNLGQVIDSSGAALLLMIKEEEPGLITKHGLATLEHDAAVSGDPEDYMWGHAGFAAAVTEYFKDVAVGSPEKNLDYDFWIRAAVRWLFAKRPSVGSWEADIRAYNGSGAQATHYRQAVTKRAGEAGKAQAAGREFVPEGL